MADATPGWGEMKPAQKEALRKNIMYLKQEIYLSQDEPGVLDFLYQEGVINADMRESILSKSSSGTRVVSMVDRLTRLGSKGFIKLIEGLQELEQHWVADKLLADAAAAAPDPPMDDTDDRPSDDASNMYS